jgi:ABC transport system ATP-binding/permease protein
MALINLNNISIGFGGPLLLNETNLQIHTGERVCLLGRNGTGKTTLMKIINGDIEPDHGTISRQQGVKITFLTQEVPLGLNGSVFEVVMSGLGQKGTLPKKYHQLSIKVAEEDDPALLEELDQVQKALEGNGGWALNREAETIITRMNLDPDGAFDSLSAGMKRRVLLARALVCKPDVLLLDEPTNHLDLKAITWLEDFLLRMKSTLLFVTHDRMLVRKLATRIVELDRGILSSWECDYATFLERKEATLDAERQQRNVFDKKLAQEEIWIRQGIKARRTRNEGRVAALLRMREQKRVRQEKIGNVKMHAQDGGLSGKLVAETDRVSFSYDSQENNKTKPVVRDLSTLVMRGDRIGIIGPNGCGKTTLLRLLLGELGATEGKIKLGTNLQIAYFDQLRNQLKDEESVQDNVGEGNDRLSLDGKTRHIIGYLQDFLFTPERSRSAVKILSGGERNRLLLAKLFAKPSNLLVLDEPTNDLDVETLELLEDLLVNYKGTLLLVSHDRAFLNNVVTASLVFEEEGKFTEYIGGYDDWLMQRPRPEEPDQKSSTKEKQKKSPQAHLRPKKLSNKEKTELENIPEMIEQLEKEQDQLVQQMSDPSFFQQNQAGGQVVQVKNRLESLKKELTSAFERWEELEERRAANTTF